MRHFAVFISHFLESLGISLSNKTGTKLQLLQIVLLDDFLRAAWAVKNFVLVNELKSVEIIFKFRHSFYCALESLDLLRMPPVCALFSSWLRVFFG